MPTPILYHYDLSPFSEKIRLMFGYTGLDWQSVAVSPMPPRPELDVLVGGYRKIPVMQMGADVYCDTRTIAAEVARLAGKPELALENCSAEAQAFAQEIEGQLFTALVVSSGGRLMGAVLRRTSLLTTLRFVKDRVGIAMKARTARIAPRQGKLLIQQHLAATEQQLTADFLFGQTPCAADFSAAFYFWFACEVIGYDWLAQAPRLRGWYERMQAYGHGTPERLTADQALDQARSAEPAGIASGKLDTPVAASVEPADYAREPTAGRLVAETETCWVLQREHPRVGTVHVHFPRGGYRLRR